MDFKTRDLPLQEMKVSILKDKTSGDGQAGILPIAHGPSKMVLDVAEEVNATRTKRWYVI